MNPTDFSLTISPSLTKAPVAGLGAQKNVPAVLVTKTVVPRVDLEPIYTQLKGLLGDHWADYKAAVNAFVLGSLNQSELTWVLQPILSITATAPTPWQANDANRSTPAATLYLHNALLAGIYANTLRDPPTSDVAPWVVATDKPTSAIKNGGVGSGANDKAEERLKHEVMMLHPRDRKRIKVLKEAGSGTASGLKEMCEYNQELALKAPSQQTPQQLAQQQQQQSAAQAQAQGDAAPTAAPAAASAPASTGLAKTNWDLEIRRRYAQPLAAETVEFPSLSDVQNRIEPICYEVGLVGGVQQGSIQGCAELVEQAAEVFVKEMLSGLLAHVRSNAPNSVEGVQTNWFKRQLRKAEMDVDRGILQRNAAGLLPVEMEMQASADPMNMHDLRLSLGLQDPFLRSDHFLEESAQSNHYPVYLAASLTNGFADGANGHASVNGKGKHKSELANANPGVEDPDAMVIDDLTNYGVFKGVGKADLDGVMNALDDCLMAAG